MPVTSRAVARVVAASAVAIVAVVAVGLAWPLPAAWTAPQEHRRVVDRRGEVLLERRIPDRGRALWVERDQVAPAVIDALLASEDDRFYAHFGVDPRAVVRAARANWQAGHVVQGGSTLTQQAARLVAPRPPGLWGKVVEAWRALRLEAHLSKGEILTIALNRAWFGGGAAGIEAGAQELFGESASGLSVSEAATLVGLLPAPERLDPRRDRPAARAARDRVLDRMVATGRLDAGTAALAKAEPLQLRRPPRPGLAPHLAVRLLAEHDDTVIRTTIDADLQRDVEALAADQITALRDRRVSQAAVLVVHWPSSEVRAWVGSADWNADDGRIDGVLTRRSPGSALKPFVFGVAFEGELRPGDVVPDLPVQYRTPHGTWSPGNYSGVLHGPVRARVALAASMNLPAVAVLDRVGVAPLYARLEGAGIGLTAPPITYGLGLALGDAEIPMADLVTAYAGLARGGVSRPLRVRPEDPEGPDVRFLDPTAALLIRDVLSDPLARSPAFGRHGPLERRYDAAVKTGTSQGFRDNWTVGWAGDWVVGVWVGNFDGSPMGDVSGVTGAGPLWAAVIDRAIGEASPRFSLPDDWTVHRLCALSGDTAGPDCPVTVDERLPPDRAPRPACHWHQPGGAVAWPAEYGEWAARAGKDPFAGGAVGEGTAAITWPGNGAVLHVDRRIPAADRAIALRATAPSGARAATWTVDDRPLADVGPPFHARWPDPPAGTHRIALAVDGEPAGSVTVEVR